MHRSWIIIGIVSAYLLITSFLGFYQSKKVKKAREFIFSKLTAFQAATFLAGFTLGGVSTYGVAGDTIKFGLTYLVWFPISIALGWWLTGIFFAKPYFEMKGTTLPALMGKRFDERTRTASSVSMMIYTIFVIVIELYTLAMIIRAVIPTITMFHSILISLIACTATVAFSGIMGASITNLIHSATMVIAFGLVFATMLGNSGGWENALTTVSSVIPQLSGEDISASMWLSPLGLGWGAVGQIMLAKAGRLGGISAVSNLAASCRTEKDARKAFWLAGLISAIPPLLSCSIGILTAAYLGPRILDMPIYSAIGFAVGEYSPVLAGIFLSAIIAAILSTFSPLALSFSSVFIEDIVKKVWIPSEKIERWLYPISIILISSLCAAYVLIKGVEHIMPFVFSTAFPCTIPNTLLALFSVKTKHTSILAAFLAIFLGVGVSLTWGLVLNDPFGIPNIVVAFFLPLIILGSDLVIQHFKMKTIPKKKSSLGG